jgi:hypothetical protein
MIYKELNLGTFNTVTAEIEQSFGSGYSILIYDEHLYWVELYAMTLEKAEKIAENEFNKCINELKTKGFN